MEAIVILGIVAGVCWYIVHRSAQKSERAYWAGRTSKECSAYGVDNSQSLIAIIAVIVLAAVVTFILTQTGMFPQ